MATQAPSSCSGAIYDAVNDLNDLVRMNYGADAVYFISESVLWRG